MHSKAPQSNGDADSPLSLSAEEMRSLGYSAVDLLIQHLCTLDQTAPRGIINDFDPDAMLNRPPSQHGRPWREVIDELSSSVFIDRLQLHHPRTFSHIPSPGNFIASIADFLASGMNIFSGTWAQSRGPMTLERAVINWLVTSIGLPEGSQGMVTSGGSEGNFLALAAALYSQRQSTKPTIYWSDQVHHSLLKAARVLRLPSEAIRSVASDDRGVIDVDVLERTLSEDLSILSKDIYMSLFLSGQLLQGWPRILTNSLLAQFAIIVSGQPFQLNSSVNNVSIRFSHN